MGTGNIIILLIHIYNETRRVDSIHVLDNLTSVFFMLLEFKPEWKKNANNKRIFHIIAYTQNWNNELIIKSITTVFYSTWSLFGMIEKEKKTK